MGGGWSVERGQSESKVKSEESGSTRSAALRGMPLRPLRGHPRRHRPCDADRWFARLGGRPAARGGSGPGRRCRTRPQGPGQPARRAARRREGRGARRGRRRRLDRARARGSCRLLDEAEKVAAGRAQGRGSTKVREALAKAEENINLGASKVTIKAEGHPPHRGDPAPPDAVGQHDHRPPRAGGGRGDEPRARPGDRRQAVLRGARPRRRAGGGRRPTFFTGDGSIGLMGAGREPRRDGQADGRLQRPVPRRSSSRSARSATSRPARPRPTPSSRSPGSPGSGRCS